MNRKFDGMQSDGHSTEKLTNTTGSPSGLQPKVLMQLLQGIITNPSLMDQLTDKSNKSQKAVVPDENPSQAVNDGSTDKVKSSGFSEQDPYEKYLNEKKMRQETESFNGKSVFQYMLEHKLTIGIPPNGYVRRLFPHWDDRDWCLSNYANERMLQVFDKLRTASDQRVISYKVLTNCYMHVQEFATGTMSKCLPPDYPFIPFMRLLTHRLKTLAKCTAGLKELKFQIPDELNKMMNVIIVQLST